MVYAGFDALDIVQSNQQQPRQQQQPNQQQLGENDTEVSNPLVIDESMRDSSLQNANDTSTGLRPRQSGIEYTPRKDINNSNSSGAAYSSTSTVLVDQEYSQASGTSLQRHVVRYDKYAFWPCEIEGRYINYPKPGQFVQGNYGVTAMPLSAVVDIDQEQFDNLKAIDWTTVDRTKIFSYAETEAFSADFIKDHPYILKCLYCNQFKYSGQGMKTHARGDPNAANFFRSICQKEGRKTNYHPAIQSVYLRRTHGQ